MSSGGSFTLRPARAVVDGVVVDQPSVHVADGRVVDSEPAGATIVYLPGATLLPGFLDVHVHGGAGFDFMDATPEALRAICRIHARHGTTGLLATTITQSRERINQALAAAREATDAGAEFCPDGALVLGIHLEGPYISPAKPGAQPREFVRDYDIEEFAQWMQIAGNALRRITLAPERPGADALTEACRQAGVRICAGHTDIDAAGLRAYLETVEADATHCFNAMNGIHHRNPGPIPVFLTHPAARIEIIPDGHHVAPDVVAMAVAARGCDRVIAITDAMAGAAAGDGTYDIGGHAATVANGKALLPDGTLAGSILTMDKAAHHLRVWCNADWAQVARMTSTNAAERLGWTSKGWIRPGCDADLVAVDEAGNTVLTMVAGRIVWNCTSSD